MVWSWFRQNGVASSHLARSYPGLHRILDTVTRLNCVEYSAVVFTALDFGIAVCEQQFEYTVKVLRTYNTNTESIGD